MAASQVKKEFIFQKPDRLFGATVRMPSAEIRVLSFISKLPTRVQGKGSCTVPSPANRCERSRQPPNMCWAPPRGSLAGSRSATGSSIGIRGASRQLHRTEADACDRGLMARRNGPGWPCQPQCPPDLRRSRTRSPVCRSPNSQTSRGRTTLKVQPRKPANGCCTDCVTLICRPS